MSAHPFEQRPDPSDGIVSILQRYASDLSDAEARYVALLIREYMRGLL